MLAARPDARFVFVGGVDPHGARYAEEVRGRAAALGLEGAVSFLGHRDDAVRLIAGADLLLVTSRLLPGFHGWREGGPLVAAEALHVGTPVVAYDDPAVVELLDGCGAVVPTGDVESLARTTAALLASPEQRSTLAACGRRRALDLRLDRAVAELVDVYRAVAAR
ncbi:MAG TPA: glycosyltransferase [Gaiellaceae bacterium]|nr:glycosyltransferase [Gaiellaceae bacterium]